MNNETLLNIYVETAQKKPFSLSKNSLDSYMCNISYLIDFLDGKNILDITHKDIKRYLLEIKDVSNGTYNLRINSFKSLYKVLKYHPDTEDLVLIDPSYGLQTMKMESVIKTPLTREEQKSLIRGCKNKRDKAIVVTLLETGLRIHELINLTLEQYQNRDEDGKLFLTVNKGSYKDEYIYITPEAEKVIDLYLLERKTGCEYLFVSNGGKQMDRTCVSRTIKNIARKTGEFEEDRIGQLSNHLMRHSFATNLVNEDVPLDIIAKAVRHHSLGTVLTYAKTSEDRVKMAVCN